MQAHPLRRGLHLLLAFALVVSQLLLLAPSTAYGLPEVTVNSTGDASDTNHGDRICDTGATIGNGAAECTLRAALEESNATDQVSEIWFGVPDTDPHYNGGQPIIRPNDVLPAVSRRVTIDGSTQGSSPGVILDGSVAGSGDRDGLLIQANQTVVRGLVVRNFADDGIEVHANRVTLVGNHITNNDDGVLVEDGVRPAIGGSASDDRNAIFGNRKHGVSLDTADNATVVGNYIGLDPTGAPDPNGEHGIDIWDGTSTAQVTGNVVAANEGHGLFVRDGASNVDITSNHIGTNPAGTAAAGNGGDGVRVTDAARAIDIGPGNVISGNGGNGITTGAGAIRVSIEGNLIGTDSSGGSAIPNAGHGIDYSSSTNRDDIGGASPTQANVIAFNGGDGISIGGPSDLEVAIVGNSIFANQGLGIDLPQHSSFNVNDPGDSDAGPNHGLNYPTVVAAEETAGTVYVDYELDVPNGYYRVEFFSNPSGGDATGYGEGEQHIGVQDVRVTNITNSFSHTFSGNDGDVLTSIATRCDSSCSAFHYTSEFSPAHVVTIGNHAPTLDPIGPLSVDEEIEITFTAAADDADGDGLTFSLEGAPTDAAIDPDTGVFSWTPTEADGPGTFHFDIRVTDDGAPVNLETTTPVAITVREVNQAPNLDDPGDFTIAEGTQLGFTATASDPDEPANNLAFGLGGSAPNGSYIDPDTGVFTWTPTEAQGPGAYTFDLIVDDGTASRSVSVSVLVSEVNEAPNLTSPGDQANAEGSSVSLPLQADDVDLPTNTLTFSATGLPPGLTIHPGTGVISGTVQYTAAVGSPHNVTVRVTDGVASDSTTFRWVTDNTNRPPVLGAIPAFTVDEHETVYFDVQASDPDAGSRLRFSLTGAPSGAAIDPISGVLTWTPGEADGPAAHTFSVVVSDIEGASSLSATRTVRVTVNEVNRPPVMTNPGQHTVDEQTPISIQITASDPDLPANNLTYRLGAGAPSGVAIDPTTGLLTWTPGEAYGPSTYTFDIRVDDRLATVTRPISITVNEVNRQPSIGNPGDQDHAEADSVRVRMTASDPDLPANDLRFSAIGLPPGLAIDPNTGVIAGTIGHSAATTSPHVVSVTVSDGAGGTATTQFTWTTANTNRPPLFDTIAPLTVAEHQTLVFGVGGHDPDPGSTLEYRMVGGPTGAALNPTTGRFSWTPTEQQGPGRYQFEVEVIDDDPQRLSTAQEVTVTVLEANRAPFVFDDRGTTSEDTSVTIEVLANDSDSDFPANTLRIAAVSAPDGGGFASVTGSSIVYRPALNFHGQVEFDYLVSDGVDTTQGTVAVTVTPVNDKPVAADDHYRLVSYQPAELDVLANDEDADRDRLGLSLVTLPDHGRARVEGGNVVYQPPNGWTGAVEFDYMARDGDGASAIATIHIVVGNEVLVGARTLANDLGVDVVPFDPDNPAIDQPTFDAETLSLIDLSGVTLLADSFFQTVGALRVPLGFLGVTVAMIIGFGATSEVPALVFGSRRRHWAIVRLGRHQRLPAYGEPGGRRVVYNFDPTASGIVSNGRPRKIGDRIWVPIDTPNGSGWIYKNYLTEQVDLHAFANDSRPVELVHELANRLREGRSIASLVGGDGLIVALTGSSNQIAPEELKALMGDRRLQHVPGFDKAPNTSHEFSVAVAQPFLEAYDATAEITAETPHSRSALIPTECWNFPYLALGTRSHRQPWLVFFEYRNGKAWIAGLGVDE